MCQCVRESRHSAGIQLRHELVGMLALDESMLKQSHSNLRVLLQRRRRELAEVVVFTAAGPAGGAARPQLEHQI